MSPTGGFRDVSSQNIGSWFGTSEDGDGEGSAAEGPEEGAGAEDEAGAEGSAEQAGLAPEKVEEEPATGEEDEDLEAERTSVLHALLCKQTLLCSAPRR